MSSKKLRKFNFFRKNPEASIKHPVSYGGEMKNSLRSPDAFFKNTDNFYKIYKFSGYHIEKVHQSVLQYTTINQKGV